MSLKEQEELARNRAVILNKVIHKKMTQMEAAIHLKVSDRQIRNLIKIYKLYGEKGLIHGLTGKKSNNRLDLETEEKIKYVAGLDKLAGAKPIFVKEKLGKDYDVNVSKETVRKIMINENLWTKRIDKRKSVYRMRRPRKLYYGEMSQFDGSYHEWLSLSPGEVRCLLLDVDDATGYIMHAKLCDNEGFEEVTKFRQERIMKHGAPRIIYTDGFSTYKPSASPKAIQQGDTMPQFSRIMKWIGTEIIITKNGPQGKGRIERYNGIVQDRLLHELQYYGVDSIEEANKFINEVFIPEYNKQFGIKPALEGDVHIKLSEEQISNMKWLFCKRFERSLSYDYIIQFMNEYYQIRKSNEYIIFPKKKMVVGRTIEGEIGIFDGWCKLKQVDFVKLDTRNVRIKRAEIFGPKDKERIENERKRKEENKLKKEQRLKESKDRKYHYQAERLLEKKIKFDQGLFDWMGEIGD